MVWDTLLCVSLLEQELEPVDPVGPANLNPIVKANEIRCFLKA